MDSLIYFVSVSFKIDNITRTLNPDPNGAEIQDPDPNMLYLNSQHWYRYLLIMIIIIIYTKC